MAGKLETYIQNIEANIDKSTLGADRLQREKEGIAKCQGKITEISERLEALKTSEGDTKEEFENLKGQFLREGLPFEELEQEKQQELRSISKEIGEATRNLDQRESELQRRVRILKQESDRLSGKGAKKSKGGNPKPNTEPNPDDGKRIDPDAMNPQPDAGAGAGAPSDPVQDSKSSHADLDQGNHTDQRSDGGRQDSDQGKSPDHNVDKDKDKDKEEQEKLEKLRVSIQGVQSFDELIVVIEGYDGDVFDNFQNAAGEVVYQDKGELLGFLEIVKEQFPNIGDFILGRITNQDRVGNLRDVVRKLAEEHYQKDKNRQQETPQVIRGKLEGASTVEELCEILEQYSDRMGDSDLGTTGADVAEQIRNFRESVLGDNSGENISAEDISLQALPRSTQIDGEEFVFTDELYRKILANELQKQNPNKGGVPNPDQGNNSDHDVNVEKDKEKQEQEKLEKLRTSIQGAQSFDELIAAIEGYDGGAFDNFKISSRKDNDNVVLIGKEAVIKDIHNLRELIARLKPDVKQYDGDPAFEYYLNRIKKQDDTRILHGALQILLAKEIERKNGGGAVAGDGAKDSSLNDNPPDTSQDKQQKPDSIEKLSQALDDARREYVLSEYDEEKSVIYQKAFQSYIDGIIEHELGGDMNAVEGARDDILRAAYVAEKLKINEEDTFRKSEKFKKNHPMLSGAADKWQQASKWWGKMDWKKKLGVGVAAGVATSGAYYVGYRAVASALSATGLAVMAKAHLDKKSREKFAEEGMEEMEDEVFILDAYMGQLESLNRALEGRFSRMEKDAKDMRKTRQWNRIKAVLFGTGTTAGMFVAGRLAAEPINNAFEHYFGSPDVPDTSPEAPSPEVGVETTDNGEPSFAEAPEGQYPPTQNAPEGQDTEGGKPEAGSGEAEAKPEAPTPSSAENFFGDAITHEVEKGDTIWGVLDDRAKEFLPADATDKQKLIFVDSLENKLQAMSAEDLQTAGISSGKADLIYYDVHVINGERYERDVIDFSKLYNQGDIQEALKAADIEGNTNINTNIDSNTESGEPSSAETSEGQQAASREQKVESDVRTEPQDAEREIKSDLPPVVEKGIEEAKEMWGLEETKVNPLVREFIVDGKVGTDQYEEFLVQLPSLTRLRLDIRLDEIVNIFNDTPRVYYTLVNKEISYFGTISEDVRDQALEIVKQLPGESNDDTVRRIFTQFHMLKLAYKP